jgi:hypothetical protein
MLPCLPKGTLWQSVIDLAVVGVVKADQPDHVQLMSSENLIGQLPDKGFAKVNSAVLALLKGLAVSSCSMRITSVSTQNGRWIRTWEDRFGILIWPPVLTLQECLAEGFGSQLMLYEDHLCFHTKWPLDSDMGRPVWYSNLATSPHLARVPC